MRPGSHKSYEQFHSSYSMLEQLGEGKFGKVYSIRDNLTHQEHAVKVISCKSSRDVQEAEQEIQIAGQLDHPNIIKVIEYYRETYHHSQHSPLCNFSIVIELGVCSLHDALKDGHYHYDLADVRRFLANLIDAGAYLESKELVHRDIKPGNIIIFGEHLAFKLADFGLSCKAHQRPLGFAGTVDYCSPMLQEFYRANLPNKRPISNAFKDDVYSVGLTIIEVLRRIGFDWREKIEDPLWQTLTIIVKQMLQKDERDRPTFSDLMRSEFIHEEFQITQPRPPKSILLREPMAELEREEEPQTVRKLIVNPMQPQHKPTQVERPSYSIKRYFYDIDCGVRAVCRLNRSYVLCGDDMGRILVFDCFSKKSYQLSVRHQFYVARIMLDEDSNIWTAGGDGQIFLFTNENLLRCIKNNQVKEIQERCGLLTKRVETKLKINIEEDDYRIIHRGPPKKYLITFVCFSPRQYVVAYADGSIYVQWQDKQTTYFSIFDVPTNIQIVRDKIYTSFFKGSITRFDLKSFTRDNVVYNFKHQIINFKVEQERDILTIEAVNHSGSIETIKIDQSHQNYQQKEQLTLTGVLGACFYENMWFLLSKDGIICPKGQDPIQCPKGKGWTCLQASNQGLVGSSLDGQLVLLDLELA